HNLYFITGVVSCFFSLKNPTIILHYEIKGVTHLSFWTAPFYILNKRDRHFSLIQHYRNITIWQSKKEFGG
ncbi:hypothetical protein QTP99_11645, partial [Caldanaerobacter subterraneus KAk]|uniref:hypothetical protein n=1 Tax=Caldanaerobacter subterraneus TaxID=911092 RepID=UPI0032BF96C0